MVSHASHHVTGLCILSYSNPLTVEFVLQHSEMGPYGVDSPYVDGTFLGLRPSALPRRDG